MVIVGNWKIWRVKEKVITTLLLESNHAGITHINSILSVCVCVCVCVRVYVFMCVCVCVQTPFSFLLGSVTWLDVTSEDTGEYQVRKLTPNPEPHGITESGGRGDKM